MGSGFILDFILIHLLTQMVLTPSPQSVVRHLQQEYLPPNPPDLFNLENDPLLTSAPNLTFPQPSE